MVDFKSIIVFDSETTSVPEIDHNTTKIIEMAFLGCEVEHLRQSDYLPRVLHKLVLLFNPQKMIHPNASEVSGLSNSLLQHVKPFRKEDVEMLRQFISRLPEPVCLVAHNGDKFDFPILRRAMKKVGRDIQNNVYCADSCKAFRSLLPKKDGLSSQYSNRKSINETTPPHQRTQPVTCLHPKNVCRVLFPNDESPPQGNSINIQSFCRTPNSYKLQDIYYFYFSKYFQDAHRAEKDSKALLSCIMQCRGFLEWISQNAVVFNSIEPLV